MYEEIKTVRLKYEKILSNGNKQSFTNYKLYLLEGKRKKDRVIKVTVVDDVNKLEVPQPQLTLTYDYSKRYDGFSDGDYIQDYIKTQEILSSNFTLIQDPWQDKFTPPRNFGTDYYYLNNGTKISISWTRKSGKEIWADYTYDTQTGSWTKGTKQLPEWMFPNTQDKPYYNLFGVRVGEFELISGDKWCDETGEEVGTIYAKNQQLPPKGYYSFGLEKSYEQLLSIQVTNALNGTSSIYFQQDVEKKVNLVYDRDTGEPWDGQGMASTVQTIKNKVMFKSMDIWPPFDSVDKDTILNITTDDKIEKFVKLENRKKWNGGIADFSIISDFIELWKKKVPNYNDLALCNPSGLECKLIEYKSPLVNNDVPPVEDNKPVESNPVDSQKFPLTIVYDTNKVIKVGEDIPNINIYFGDAPKEDQYAFTDDFEDLALLDDEYREQEFQGEGESILSLEDIKDIQEELNNQKKNGEIPPDLPPGDTKNLPPKSPGGDDGTYALQFNGVPYYAQWDARWGTDAYSIKNKDGTKKQKCTESSGKESTLTSSGCGVTSVTMVINYWATKGKTGGKFTTPKEMGDVFSKNGGRVCNSGSAMSADVKKYIESTFGLSWTFLSNESKVIEALKKKYPVVICGAKYKGLNHKGDATSLTTNGHYIVLTGIDSTGAVRVNDPGYRLTKAIAAFPNGDIVGDSRTPRYNVLIYPIADGAPTI